MSRGRIDETGLKKGPWSAEEDEVLINFVKENGRTGWSSIRSKGLLPRTGKSCRLRWVNKLRPDLKVRCKFTAEEERVVVELQARYGNKWAKIASHLEGRTDNDVKNFWSSRRKRLARMLHSSSESYSKSQKQCKHNSPIPPHPPNLQVHTESSNRINQVSNQSSEHHPPESSFFRPSELEPITATQSTSPRETGLSTIPSPLVDLPLPDPLWLTQLANPLPLDTQLLLPDQQMGSDFVNAFDESNTCSDLFPCMNDHCDPLMHETVTEIGLEGEFFGGPTTGSYSKSCQQEDAGENLGNSDGSFDDCPTDVFDCLDPLPNFSNNYWKS